LEDIGCLNEDMESGTVDYHTTSSYGSCQVISAPNLTVYLPKVDFHWVHGTLRVKKDILSVPTGVKMVLKFSENLSLVLMEFLPPL
jgi:hypothetical protein